MKLSEWRQGQRREATLPSGLSVVMRRAVTLVDLASRGMIPAPLVSMVNAMMDAKTHQVVSVEDFSSYGQAIDLVVRAALIEPAVGDSADEGHIELSELTLDDRVFVFNLAHEEGKKLEPFRVKADGAVEAAPAG
jgi:hypothetical protein